MVNDLSLHFDYKSAISIFMLPVRDGRLGNYLSVSDNDSHFSKRHDLCFGCRTFAVHHASVRGITHQGIKPSSIIVKDE